MSPAPNQVHRLIYLSAAVGTPSPTELDEILASPRRNNAGADVTGPLLFHDGCFFQVLEGPIDKVTRVFDTIQRDRRHRGIIVLENSSQPTRAFERWAMGYLASQALTKGQRESLIDLSALLGRESEIHFTSSKSATLHIETFLATFWEFERQ